MTNTSFTFVLVPSNDAESLQLLDRSVDGGLELDELQIFAKNHLKTDFDGHARMDSVSAHLKTVGMEGKELDERYKDAIFHMGVSLDIVTLQLPLPANDYIGVSIYCDADGIAKEFKANTRATRLAQACGHNIIIYGDACIGRFHDDESMPWNRLDFGLEEASPDARWVQLCAEQNKGRDLRKFTSAGAFSTAATGIDNFEDPHRPELKPTPPDDDVILGDNLIWSQTDNDVEVRVTNLPSTITAKQLKIAIKTNRLHVTIPSSASASPVSKAMEKLQDAQGGELFSSIHPDESTWSLDSSGTSKTLVISLTKANKMRWLELVR